MSDPLDLLLSARKRAGDQPWCPLKTSDADVLIAYVRELQVKLSNAGLDGVVFDLVEHERLPSRANPFGAAAAVNMRRSCL